MSVLAPHVTHHHEALAYLGLLSLLVLHGVMLSVLFLIQQASPHKLPSTTAV